MNIGNAWHVGAWSSTVLRWHGMSGHRWTEIFEMNSGSPHRLTFSADILRRAAEKVFATAVYRIVERYRGDLKTIGGVCPRTLAVSRIDSNSKVLSGGVGGDISFELELTAETGCRVALFDPSPTGARTIAALSPLPSTITYYPLGITAGSGTRLFAEPFNPGEGSFRHPSAGERGSREWPATSIEDFMTRENWSRVDIIKLDIEGFEYEVLRSLLRTGIRPGQLLVEFHYGRNNTHSFWEYLQMLLALRSAGFILVHRRYADHTFALRSRQRKHGCSRDSATINAAK